MARQGIEVYDVACTEPLSDDTGTIAVDCYGKQDVGGLLSTVWHGLGITPSVNAEDFFHWYEVQPYNLRNQEPVGDVRGPGIFIVGEHIAPGIYQFEGVTLCAAQRLSSLDGDSNSIVEVVSGGSLVEVKPTDVAVNVLSRWALVPFEE